MSNHDTDDNEESTESNAKPTITIAEKDGSQQGEAQKDTITIAEKNKPKNP